MRARVVNTREIDAAGGRLDADFYLRLRPGQSGDNDQPKPLDLRDWPCLLCSHGHDPREACHCGCGSPTKERRAR